jgi:hypothetical protein
MGVDREVRRKMLDAVNEINRQTYEELGDPETNARIAQYEMAYRMQTSVPELADLSKEPQSTWDLYGPEAKEPGTFAYNCLMARRLAERGVRFTQVYKRGWDMHDNVTGILPIILRETDRGCYALVTDLKQRGLLDDTLVIWAGEFGRTVYSQGGLTPDNYGRDHHPRCYTHVDDRRRRAHRHHLRRDRRLQLQRGQGSGHSSRFQRDHSALPGHRPQQADLQVSGARSETDRARARQRCSGPAGVKTNQRLATFANGCCRKQVDAHRVDRARSV